MKEAPENQLKLLKNFIQYKASNQGMNLTQLLEKVSEKYGTNKDLSNFSAKFRRKSVTMLQIYQIMDILNIDIEFKDRN